MNWVFWLSASGESMTQIAGLTWPDLRDSAEFPDYFYETETRIRFRGSPFVVLERKGCLASGAPLNRIASMLCGDPIFGSVNIIYRGSACKVVERSALVFIEGICSLLGPLCGDSASDYDVDVFMLRAGYDKILKGLDTMIEAENNCEEWEDCF